MNLLAAMLLPGKLAAIRAGARRLEMASARWRRALRASYPRADESWSPAEDRRLLRLVEQSKSIPHGLKYKRWNDIGGKLGRTGNAVSTRYYALRAGMRLR